MRGGCFNNADIYKKSYMLNISLIKSYPHLGTTFTFKNTHKMDMALIKNMRTYIVRLHVKYNINYNT